MAGTGAKIRQLRNQRNPPPQLPKIQDEPVSNEKPKNSQGKAGSLANSVRQKRQGRVDASENRAYALPNVPDENPEEILKRLREGEKNFLDDLIGEALDFSDNEEAEAAGPQPQKDGKAAKNNNAVKKTKPSVEQLRWKSIRHADYFRMLNWVQNGKEDDLHQARDLLFKEDEAIEREELEAEGRDERDPNQRNIPDLSDGE